MPLCRYISTDLSQIPTLHLSEGVQWNSAKSFVTILLFFSEVTELSVRFCKLKGTDKIFRSVGQHRNYGFGV